MIAALPHGALYVLPGGVLLALAALMNRLTARAIAAARGTEPAWARRWARFAVAMIGCVGLALLMTGVALAWVALRARG